MRLCVISNSHAAALKLGWQRRSEPQRLGIEATFFAAPNHLMEHLRLRDGCLGLDEPKAASFMRSSSGGLAEIDPALYDVYLLHGMGLKQDPLAQIATGTAPYSSGLLLAMAGRLVQASLAWRTHAMLRNLTRKPIFLSPAPLRSELAANTASAAQGSAKQVALQPHLNDLLPMLQLKGLGDLSDPSAASWLVPQPPATLLQGHAQPELNGHYTAQAFSVGAERLEGGPGLTHPASDTFHMNSHYGAAFWDMAIAHLLNAANTAAHG